MRECAVSFPPARRPPAAHIPFLVVLAVGRRRSAPCERLSNQPPAACPRATSTGGTAASPPGWLHRLCVVFRPAADPRTVSVRIEELVSPCRPYFRPFSIDYD